MNEIIDHLKFFLHSGHAAELPEGTGLPVLSDLWHCLQREHPQFLQLMEDDDPQPEENLHINKNPNTILTKCPPFIQTIISIIYL